MRQLRALIQRLRGLFSSRSADSDFGAELESHIAFDIDAGIHSGLSREEARRQALIRLGGAEQTRQAYRERQTLPWVEGLIQDLRYGLRMMARKAGFTTIAVLTLAIGIGASTAIFSAIKPILIDALPYPHASRLTMLWEMRTNGATCLTRLRSTSRGSLRQQARARQIARSGCWGNGSVLNSSGLWASHHSWDATF